MFGIDTERVRKRDRKIDREIVTGWNPVYSNSIFKCPKANVKMPIDSTNALIRVEIDKDDKWYILCIYVCMYVCMYSEKGLHEWSSFVRVPFFVTI